MHWDELMVQLWSCIKAEGALMSGVWDPSWCSSRSWSAAGSVTENPAVAASIKTSTSRGTMATMQLACLSACVSVCALERRGCVCGGVHFSVHSNPSLTYSMALKSVPSVAVLSRLCLRITACLLWSPAPTLKRCGPKMFYLLSGLASIKLMESIQLFPFQAQTTEENTLKRS